MSWTFGTPADEVTQESTGWTLGTPADEGNDLPLNESEVDPGYGVGTPVYTPNQRSGVWGTIQNIRENVASVASLAHNVTLPSLIAQPKSSVEEELQGAQDFRDWLSDPFGNIANRILEQRRRSSAAGIRPQIRETEPNVTPSHRFDNVAAGVAGGAIGYDAANRARQEALRNLERVARTNPKLQRFMPAIRVATQAAVQGTSAVSSVGTEQFYRSVTDQERMSDADIARNVGVDFVFGSVLDGIIAVNRVTRSNQAFQAADPRAGAGTQRTGGVKPSGPSDNIWTQRTRSGDYNDLLMIAENDLLRELRQKGINFDDIIRALDNSGPASQSTVSAARATQEAQQIFTNKAEEILRSLKELPDDILGTYNIMNALPGKLRRLGRIADRLTDPAMYTPTNSMMSEYVRRSFQGLDLNNSTWIRYTRGNELFERLMLQSPHARSLRGAERELFRDLTAAMTQRVQAHYIARAVQQNLQSGGEYAFDLLRLAAAGYLLQDATEGFTIRAGDFEMSIPNIYIPSVLAGTLRNVLDNQERLEASFEDDNIVYFLNQQARNYNLNIDEVKDLIRAQLLVDNLLQGSGELIRAGSIGWALRTNRMTHLITGGAAVGAVNLGVQEVTRPMLGQQRRFGEQGIAEDVHQTNIIVNPDSPRAFAVAEIIAQYFGLNMTHNIRDRQSDMHSRIRRTANQQVQIDVNRVADQLQRLQDRVLFYQQSNPSRSQQYEEAVYTLIDQLLTGEHGFNFIRRVGFNELSDIVNNFSMTAMTDARRRRWQQIEGRLNEMHQQ